MNCPRSEEIDRLIGESLDGVEARALRDHMAGCGACAGEELRARKEKDMFVEELALWRLKSDLSRKPMAPRRRGMKWLRLLPAAVILAAIGTAMWLARPDRTAPAAGDRLISMEIVRRDDKGQAVGERRVLLENELPVIHRQFLEIGFLDRVEMDTNPADTRRFPSLEVSVRRQKAGKVESWKVNVGASGFVTYSRDGRPGQSASMHPNQFRRLWAVLEGAASSLTEIRVGRELDSLRKVAAVEVSRLGRMLEAAGFWREVEAAVPLDARPPEEDGLVIEATRHGRKTRVLLTGGVNRGRMLVADDGPADRTGEPSKETFDRLWSIVERALEPLQVYLERKPDGGHRALLVYRGGAAGWKDAGDVGLLLSTGGGVVAYQRVPVSEFGVRLPEKGGAFEAEIDLGKRLAAAPHDPSVSWGWEGAESPRVEAEEISGCRRAVEEILKAAAEGKAEALAARLWPVKERGREEYREVMETLGTAGGARVRMSGLTPGAVPEAVKAADAEVDAYFLVAFEKSWDREGGAAAVTGFSYSVVRREGRFLLRP